MAQRLAWSLGLVVSAGSIASVALWALARQMDPNSIRTAEYALMTGGLVTLACTITVILQQLLGGATRDQFERMEHRATHDELTGLPNRDELIRRLEAALVDGYRHDRVVGVLFIDLDGFKAINDSMGHDAGDELLRVFAERLRGAVRANDIVGRFGGDEFVVVCQGLQRQSAVREVAEHALDAFDRPLSISAGEVSLRPSIGVAVASRSNPATPEELISNGDVAMYRAKRERAGVRLFDDENRREVLDRREVERALVPALADGQFRVFYQPIVSLDLGRLIALEALIRWEHPRHGILAPDRFMPIAEESGLVARLGEVVLREAAAQVSVWNHQFPQARAVSVGVNLAEHQLVDPTFPERVAEVLDWSGVTAAQLDLEVTEDLLLRRADDASGVMQRLSALGCKIIVDDFGSSNASLTRIRRPELIDALKIDRSVIAAVDRDEVARAVVDATLSMARAMEIQVIAEGVETESQRAVLEDLGIDVMQGFLFLHPSPPDFFDRDEPGTPLDVTT